MQEALFDFTEPQPPAGTWVYVIGAEGSSVVKIGKATDIPDRLGGIQTGNPERLVIRWAVAGGRSLEKALHSQFKPFRKEGEWFDFGNLDPVEEVHRAVEQLLPGQTLLIYGEKLKLGPYPADFDPHRYDPAYQPDNRGCRRLTPLELRSRGYGPNEFITRHGCYFSHDCRFE